MQMLDPTSHDITHGCPPPGQRQPGVANNPARFLLVTQPRSGTMMVANALESDPAVRLFNLYAGNAQNPRGHHCNFDLYQWQECPVGVTHLGTTMHCVGEDWVNLYSPLPPSRFWAWVAHRHDRYICLRRENLLRQFLSRKVGLAIKTYDVLRPRSEKPVPPSLVLDPSEFVAFVETETWLKEDVERHFTDPLCLAYEELAGDWQTSYRRIQEYLGLPVRDIPPITYLQEQRPLKVAIQNYDEIAACLQQHGWKQWLQENV